MILSILAWILNALHLIFFFTPLILLVLPKRYLKKYKTFVKIVILLILLTPIHWRFLNGHCFLSLISVKMGDYKNVGDTNSPFSRQNLWWLYKPIMAVTGLKWKSEKDLNLLVNSHWVINFLASWFVLAYRLC